MRMAREWWNEIRTDARLLHHSAPGGGDTTAKEADLLKRCLFVDSNNGDVCDDGILREGGSAHLRLCEHIWIQ